MGRIVPVDPLREIRAAMRRLRRAERWMKAEIERQARKARKEHLQEHPEDLPDDWASA